MNKDELLKYYYGYTSFKDEQNKIITSVLNGNDTIGLLPTGYGKSVTFQIPALLFEGITIVITPLIALMQDQVASLKKKGIKADYINSLQSIEEQEIIYKRLKMGKIKLLYVSAERLESKRFLIEIKSILVSFIVCDEAHTLLWSEDFRTSLGKIPIFINMLNNRPRILALTATATNSTVEKIISLLELNNPNIIVGNCDRKNIFYKVIRTNNKIAELIDYVSIHKKMHGIVYCLTIKNCLYVYNYLHDKGFSVGIYHGAMEPEAKKRIQNQYTLHEIDIIVCTNAFGMGIDIPDIRYVIEYDIPSSIEDFLQQSGRGSRDGNKAESIVLFNPKDIETITYFIDHIPANGRKESEVNRIKKERYKKLDSVVEFCMSRHCLHQFISLYFGFKHNGKCGNCMNCCKKK